MVGVWIDPVTAQVMMILSTSAVFQAGQAALSAARGRCGLRRRRNLPERASSPSMISSTWSGVVIIGGQTRKWSPS
jgi:hypothetical protein